MLMTFDNACELHKIKAIYPTSRLVLRLLPPDESNSTIKLGNKFGASSKAACKLLETAKDLDLNIVGVSFHVGSGNHEPSSYYAAVVLAKEIFDHAQKIGFNLNLLDIGGGYPGLWDEMKDFEKIVAGLRQGLMENFPPSSNVKIIAEPGRYLVSSACNIALTVISKCIDYKEREFPGGLDIQAGVPECNKHFTYYLNDGVRGSFMDCLLLEDSHVTPTITNPERYADEPQYNSTLCGPSCEARDVLHPSLKLPELDEDERLWFKNMGAYTIPFYSGYGGAKRQRKFYVMENKYWLVLFSL
ncbi:hypothetical protein CAPTEDRAFT_92753 [Capitella teleta]|uniref:Orn/DAP/Arg decarboxylase 2 N-terminal domain-containing protein n=1 Tax=Capitella teleta TaxID=283909 RepID=R7T7L2_CAPTE|nr:hypothetical protein CAPTEDRAFT_92753 [Capitella teleta]|eukprot:ELT89639.1 hypothetical protein CAPTEDRAFT_92753 [Capitella teleta]